MTKLRCAPRHQLLQAKVYLSLFSLKIIIKSNIIIIIIGTLIIIIKTFETINNGIIIIKTARIPIIIIIYMCVLKLTFKINIIAVYYIIAIIMITVIKRERNKNVKSRKTFKSFLWKAVITSTFIRAINTINIIKRAIRTLKITKNRFINIIRNVKITQKSSEFTSFYYNNKISFKSGF